MQNIRSPKPRIPTSRFLPEPAAPVAPSRSAAALLVLLALLCGGCRSCRPDGAGVEVVGREGPARPVPAGPGVEPPAPAGITGDPTPRPPAPSAEALNREVHESGLIVDIHFDFDRFELTPAARSGLDHNARFLRRSPSVLLRIEGHCDERGTHEYNLALGQLRAAAARAYLVRLGIAAERLDTVSYGEDRGVCHASSERCWARNRRAYFRVVGL